MWFAAGRLGSMRSCTSAQLCSMLAWWAPRHGGVAVPSAMLSDTDSCGPPPPPLRPGTGRGRDQRPAVHLEFSAYLARSRGGASAPPLHPSHAQNGESRAPKACCGQQKALTALERPHRHAAVPTRPACLILRRGARAHRPQPPGCKLHPSRHPRPRLRYWSVRNRGRHAPTAQHHRLLGLALPAHRRLCHGNRSETAGEGRVRVQRGQLAQSMHDSRPHRAEPRAT